MRRGTKIQIIMRLDSESSSREELIAACQTQLEANCFDEAVAVLEEIVTEGYSGPRIAALGDRVFEQDKPEWFFVAERARGKEPIDIVWNNVAKRAQFHTNAGTATSKSPTVIFDLMRRCLKEWSGKLPADILVSIVIEASGFKAYATLWTESAGEVALRQFTDEILSFAEEIDGLVGDEGTCLLFSFLDTDARHAWILAEKCYVQLQMDSWLGRDWRGKRDAMWTVVLALVEEIQMRWKHIPLMSIRCDIFELILSSVLRICLEEVEECLNAAMISLGKQGSLSITKSHGSWKDTVELSNSLDIFIEYLADLGEHIDFLQIGFVLACPDARLRTPNDISSIPAFEAYDSTVFSSHIQRATTYLHTTMERGFINLMIKGFSLEVSLPPGDTITLKRSVSHFLQKPVELLELQLAVISDLRTSLRSPLVSRLVEEFSDLFVDDFLNMYLYTKTGSMQLVVDSVHIFELLKLEATTIPRSRLSEVSNILTMEEDVLTNLKASVRGLRTKFGDAVKAKVLTSYDLELLSLDEISKIIGH